MFQRLVWPSSAAGHYETCLDPVWFSLSDLTWPLLVCQRRCRVLVGTLRSPRWRGLYLRKRDSDSVGTGPCQHPQRTHPHGHSRNVWNLVWRCWLQDYSHWELRCVLFMTRSSFTVSVYIHITLHSLYHKQPLRHNENTQVVPGGETLEGEFVKSFQRHM